MLDARISRETAGWAGVLVVATAAATIALSVALFDGYDWGVHALSTLGHVDMAAATDSRPVFTAGLLLAAVFGLVFAVGLARLEDRRLWTAGAALYAIAHLTVAWQAIFPAGVPQHDWLSVFPFFVGALLVLGVDQLRTPETRLFGVVVLSNLAIGLLGAGLLLQTDVEGWAIHQVLGLAVFSVLTLLFAGRLLGVAGFE